MPHKTFFWFIFPSALAVIVFIALPLVSVFIQSLYVEHEQVFIEVETCDPFGCKIEVQVDTEARAKLIEEAPLGRFNGFGTYTNRNHLAFDEIAERWNSDEEFSLAFLMDLPFYRALAFTLAFTLVVTPLVIILGFIIAVCVNTLPGLIKGPVIFTSLLPMIVTPLVGALVLFWMIDANGILGKFLQYIFDDPNLSIKATPALMWIMLMVYGVWNHAPFAFIVFYAGLQTVPQDTLESAKIDGANRWECIRYVVIPYIVPLAVFITLIQLMDNFRVFEPIVSFNAEASATSLSWIIYNDLRLNDIKLFGSAAATSMLTIIGVAILLTPVIIRTWHDFNRK